jgi:hypothetical protein
MPAYVMLARLHAQACTRARQHAHDYLAHMLTHAHTLAYTHSIGTFLLSHSARSSGENSSKDSNIVAESFLLRVLPAVLTRLDNQRQVWVRVCWCLYVFFCFTLRVCVVVVLVCV